ncbi:hypothetical protein [Brevundimonas sp.]|uniref:hypothetical protein n=1 Tax=Brevundimonas sp. TaxID=1871086 RepID=UPI002D4B9DAD|nr:hypothetical protein [Brevundimonas sp.]HYD28690.1 hypothetical protein [Brevundimonas sp.]
MALQLMTWLAFAVGWLRGGHTERRAVAVLFWDHAVTRSTAGMAGAHDMVAVSEIVVALIFAWLAFRSERWWTLAASAALMLCVLVFVLEWTTLELPRDAGISARLGLWFFIYLSLLAGVAERWMAGEQAVSRAAAWRRRRSAS